MPIYFVLHDIFRQKKRFSCTLFSLIDRFSGKMTRGEMTRGEMTRGEMTRIEMTHGEMTLGKMAASA